MLFLQDRSFNGEQSSPRKTPSKMPATRLPGKCKTPVKMLQSPKSPDPSSAVPQSADKKSKYILKNVCFIIIINLNHSQKFQ